MKLLRNIILLLMFSQLAVAQTPFILTGVKSYYPVVEINTNKIDPKYRDVLLDMIIDMSKGLSINTQNFSSRSLAFLIRQIKMGEETALKMDLLLGEDAMRLDTKEEVFVVSYMSSRLFAPKDIEKEIVSNAKSLLDAFAAQYKEDNL